VVEDWVRLPASEWHGPCVVIFFLPFLPFLVLLLACSLSFDLSSAASRTRMSGGPSQFSYKLAWFTSIVQLFQLPASAPVGIHVTI
jgi:hypothetical protein